MHIELLCCQNNVLIKNFQAHDDFGSWSSCVGLMLRAGKRSIANERNRQPDAECSAKFEVAEPEEAETFKNRLKSWDC
jgi:hypothetical protein